MEFLQKWLFRHTHSPAGSHADQGRHPGRHHEHDWRSARPHQDTPHRDPRYAYAKEPEHREHDGGPHGRSQRHGVLGSLAQHKVLLVVAALLVLVVLFGGIVALVLVLPFLGTLGLLAGAQDLTALLTDLPRLVSMLLVDMPKAVLDYLAPVLQLKTALEGKA
jgi:hypothetical protein